LLAVIESGVAGIGQGLKYNMIRLVESLNAWGAPEFKEVLRQEITQLGAGHLPLQQGLSTGNYVSDAPVTVSINRVTELDNMIRVTAGIFYQGIIGGCSCTDDPTPASEINEYCEVQLDIDKTSAVTAVSLLAD
jgi:hypothetical protein